MPNSSYSCSNAFSEYKYLYSESEFQTIKNLLDDYLESYREKLGHRYEHFRSKICLISVPNCKLELLVNITCYKIPFVSLCLSNPYIGLGSELNKWFDENLAKRIKPFAESIKEEDDRWSNSLRARLRSYSKVSALEDDTAI